MKDVMGMMKQAKALQEKMAAAQAEIEALSVTGVAAAGSVSVTLSGKGAMTALHIEPSLLQPADAEMLEDLVLAAHNDAKSRLDEALASRMSAITGGLSLPPGLKLF